MLLIVGLGNIGKNYEDTFHNIGFLCLDAFLSKNSLKLNKNKMSGDSLETVLYGEKVIFVKPTTFMNRSGDCVAQYKNKYKLNSEDILILYDDYDLPIGEVRFRNKGSAGTHNGMKSIVEQLGTENFKRLRIGIFDSNSRMPLLDYVLSKIKKKEEYKKVFEKTNQFLEDYIKNKGNMDNTSF